MLYNMILTDYKQADISNDSTVIKYNYPEDKLKASLKELKEQDKDWILDIIYLIEINDYGKKDLISKMKRLCKAYQEEKDKIFGAELNG